MQAHTDQLKILADKAVTIISVNDVIEIKASQKIVLQAGQSSVTLEGGDITFACPGNFTVKGGQHIFDGGAGVAPALPPLPTQLATVLSPEQMVRQAGTHSLRFAFAGSDDVADFMGLTVRRTRSSTTPAPHWRKAKLARMAACRGRISRKAKS